MSKVFVRIDLEHQSKGKGVEPREGHDQPRKATKSIAWQWAVMAAQAMLLTLVSKMAFSEETTWYFHLIFFLGLE